MKMFCILPQRSFLIIICYNIVNATEQSNYNIFNIQESIYPLKNHASHLECKKKFEKDEANVSQEESKPFKKSIKNNNMNCNYSLTEQEFFAQKEYLHQPDLNKSEDSFYKKMEIFRAESTNFFTNVPKACHLKRIPSFKDTECYAKMQRLDSGDGKNESEIVPRDKKPQINDANMILDTDYNISALFWDQQTEYNEYNEISYENTTNYYDNKESSQINNLYYEPITEERPTDGQIYLEENRDYDDANNYFENEYLNLPVADKSPLFPSKLTVATHYTCDSKPINSINTKLMFDIQKIACEFFNSINHRKSKKLLLFKTPEKTNTISLRTILFKFIHNPNKIDDIYQSFDSFISAKRIIFTDPQNEVQQLSRDFEDIFFILCCITELLEKVYSDFFASYKFFWMSIFWYEAKYYGGIIATCHGEIYNIICILIFYTNQVCRGCSLHLNYDTTNIKFINSKSLYTVKSIVSDLEILLSAKSNSPINAEIYYKSIHKFEILDGKSIIDNYEDRFSKVKNIFQKCDIICTHKNLKKHLKIKTQAQCDEIKILLNNALIDFNHCRVNPLDMIKDKEFRTNIKLLTTSFKELMSLKIYSLVIKKLTSLQVIQDHFHKKLTKFLTDYQKYQLLYTHRNNVIDFYDLIKTNTNLIYLKTNFIIFGLSVEKLHENLCVITWRIKEKLNLKI